MAPRPEFDAWKSIQKGGFTGLHGNSFSREIGKAKPRVRPKELLLNFGINILLPFIALSVISRDGGKPWQLGPLVGMAVALAFPLIYGAQCFLRKGNANALSILGVVNILLTGWITWLAWRPNGGVDENSMWLFAVKEGALPFLIGMAILASHPTRTPLVRLIIFNAHVFDVGQIESTVLAKGATKGFQRLLWQVSIALSVSFTALGALNYFLALHFLKAVNTAAPNARQLYNSAVAQQTVWAIVVIGIPLIVLMAALLIWLLKRLKQLTDISMRQLLAK